MDAGTHAWQLAPALEVRGSDVHVRKTTPDSFLRTGLNEILQSRGVTDLVICGVQSDFCVDTNTRRAMALGYPVVLIESFGPRTTAVAAAEVRFGAQSRR
jgi:nicotinamidase-related amidase